MADQHARIVVYCGDCDQEEEYGPIPIEDLIGFDSAHECSEEEV